MERIYFVEHHGKTILIQDFSNVKSTVEFIELLVESENMVATQPEGSVLALFDATNTRYSSESLSYLKESVKKSDAYMKASSVVGITGMLVYALNSVSKIVNRKYKLAKTREEAMDWLITQ
ncbi:MAG: hypothetical protein JEZ00_10380 [Anaerolineaceae bacterium]|nr:hypothetical protein [Anaerolineaceae bacterium]